MKNKKKNIILKIIGGSTILTIAFVMVILICVLMIFDFFGAKLTKEKVQNIIICKMRILEKEEFLNVFQIVFIKKR